MFRSTAVFMLLILSLVAPATARSIQVNDEYYVELHGTLVVSHNTLEEGTFDFYAVRLETSIDLSCTSGDETCSPEYGQDLLQLVLDTDQIELFEKGIGEPARIGGTLYHSHTIHHHTPVLLSVETLNLLPRTALPVTDGRYVNDQRLCSNDPGTLGNDGLLALTGIKGSVTILGHEHSCIGVSSGVSLNGFELAAACWGEGEEYEAGFVLRKITGNSIVLNDHLLQRCSPPVTADVPVHEPRSITIDLRPPHADELGYGSRVGMDVEVRSMSGRGTSQARITAEHTERNAYAFCALYDSNPTFACIDEVMKEDLVGEVLADCRAGTFSTFWGDNYRFAGKAVDDTFAEFVILNDNGEALDGSSASGYYTALGIYQALCEPNALGRPLISSDSYDREFDRLLTWRGASLFARGGISNLPIIQFASKARPEIGKRLRLALADASLVMHGHFGFARNNGASLLVDFARRDIFACYYAQRDKPVSYRFGTVLLEGLDGFGVPCPATIDTALEEYLPLIDQGQKLFVDEWQEDNFGIVWNSVHQHPDLLGLGPVVYFDRCEQNLSFNPEWFAVFGSNWTEEGRWHSGGLNCRIEDSRFLNENDTLQVEAVCANSGYTSGASIFSVSRPLSGKLMFDDRPAEQCSSHYLAMRDLVSGGNTTILPPTHVADFLGEKMVEWGRAGTVLYRGEELELSTYVQHEEGDAVSMALTGSREGKPLFSAEVPASHSGFGNLGVFPMGEHQEPWLLFGSFSGGASCCTDIVGVNLSDARPKAQALGEYYSDLWNPEDLDDDGSYELLLDDHRFNYLYAPPSASFRPPVILAAVNGEISDVTEEVRFRPVVKELLALMSAHCGGEQGWSMSACVAWAATGTKLGTYQYVMKEIERRMSGSALPSDWQGGSSFLAVHAEIQAQLTDLGYLE